MRIVCLNTGTKYLGYTSKLYNALCRNTTKEFRFECITSSQFSSWWGKFSMHPLKEQTIYMDLDTVVCGNVDFLFDYQGPFCIRRNPWAGAWCDASLMSISEEVGKKIAAAFFENPHKVMKDFRSDQEFIAQLIPEADTWQDFAPGKTASFKADHLDDGPGGASIVAFHGEPKPHQVNNAWVKEHWR